MPNHQEYLKLTWKEKNENVGRIVHLYQNSESAFKVMNKIIKTAEEIGFFDNVAFGNEEISKLNTQNEEIRR